jgi:hypothetical protein
VAYGNSTPTISAGSGSSEVTAFANVSGLPQNTPIHYRLVAVNSDGTSVGSDLTFSTLCGIYSLPFYEGFPTTSLPTCWSQVDHQGNGQIWQFGTITGSYSGFFPLLSGNYAFLNSDAYLNGNSQNADLVSPLLDLSNFSSVTLQFNYYYRAFNGQTGTLSYSIDNGATWVAIQSFTVTSANPANFSQVIPAVALQSQVKFKWNLVASWGWYWAIDDVQINGLPVNILLPTTIIPNGSSNCYNASQTITIGGAGSPFTIQNGGIATLIAGLNIHLLPGVTVQSGGHFWGYIAPSGPFCVAPSFLANNQENTVTENETLLGLSGETTASELFKVYPNPTSGKFTIDMNPILAANEKADLHIYSMIGGTVLRTEMSGVSKSEFSLTDQPNGIYIIQVVSGGRTGTAKIIKQ